MTCLPRDGRARRKQWIVNVCLMQPPRQGAKGGPVTVAGPVLVRAPGTRKEDWIAIELRRVYDDAVEEAIPQEMLELLNALDDEDEPGEGNDG